MFIQYRKHDCQLPELFDWFDPERSGYKMGDILMCTVCDAQYKLTYADNRWIWKLVDAGRLVEVI